MNLPCYITIWPPILLLRIQVFKWSTLLIQIIHQKMKILLFKPVHYNEINKIEKDENFSLFDINKYNNNNCINIKNDVQ